MKRTTSMLITLILAATLHGCGTTKSVTKPDAGYPQPFEIELYVADDAKRFTYYVVKSNGSLAYGGGGNANVREAEVLGRLTDEQMKYLWQVIDRYKLLDGSGELFALGKTRYDLKLRVGGRRARYETSKPTDGLEHLNKALFKMQGDLKYAGIERAIDERIRESDGAVEKR